MKKLLFVLSLLLPLSLFAKKAVLTLLFRHTEKETLHVLLPSERLGDLQPLKIISPIKNDTIYRFEVDIDNPALTNFVISGDKGMSLLLHPGKECVFIYDATATPSYTVSGPYSEGQMQLCKQMEQRNPYQYEFIKDYTKAPLDTIPQKMDAAFRELERKDIAVFDSLFRARKIDRLFLNCVKRDIQLYYLGVLSCIARNACSDLKKKEFYTYWVDLYKKYPVDKMDLNSTWINRYANLYLNFFLYYDAAKMEYKVPEGLTSESQYDYMYCMYSEQIKNKAMREKLLGNKLYSMGLNNKLFSSRIIPLFEKFKKEYPLNGFIPYYNEFTQNINAFNTKATSEHSSDIRFVEEASKINTLKELLDKMKGKPVFVDFWFSTCGPCKEQFAYSKPLEEFLKQHQVEMLYVSIDDSTMHQNWMNHIKYFDLKGWHIRTSPALRRDLGKEHGIYYFPTYMLVDKEGNILLKRAKFPSQEEGLYEQIRKSLSAE